MKSLRRALSAVLGCPTAPFHEHLVAGELLRLAREGGLACRIDRFGNIMARPAANERRRRPPAMAFVAHMDHPGFGRAHSVAGGAIEAEWLGGVRADLFAGAPVRLWLPDGRPWRRAKVAEVLETEGTPRFERPKRVRLDPGSGRVDLPDGLFGTWDLPAMHIDRSSGLLSTVAADDLVGCCLVLDALIQAVAIDACLPVAAIFTVAEEVGFAGAHHLCSGPRPLADPATVLVSVETSRATPAAPIGGGPVVRVGDRSATFDPWVTRFLEQAGTESGVGFRRALMDGGTCEASLFQAYGRRTGALAVPLANYHNMGERAIEAEAVSTTDLTGARDLIKAAFLGYKAVDRQRERLVETVSKAGIEYADRLRRNAGWPETR